jgi:terminase large subunit-like protein
MAITIEPSRLRIDLHPKQMRVLKSKANEILFGGAAGPGKSFLGRALAIILCFEIPGFQAALFRRTYRELNDTHMEGPGSFPAILAGAQNEGLCRIVKDEIRFANGSRISLNHCQYEHNVTSYQGAEFHLLQIDELTHWTSYMYTYLRTRCRLGNLQIPDKYIGKLPLIVSTSNPGGIGHNWVKDFFEPDKPFVIRRMTGKGEGGMLRQFIPATIADNPDTLRNDPSYVDKLEGVGDPQTARALLEGDWDVVSDAMFGTSWKKTLHVIDPFAIPKGWDLWRGADDGFSKPACILWFARDPIKDRTYAIREVYRSGMLPEEMGREALEGDKTIPIRETDGTFSNNMYELTGLIDPASFADTGTGSPARGNAMNQMGCNWREAEKYPGSRVQGVQHVHRMLAIQKDGLPKLQIFNNCIQLCRALPTAPRDRKNPEDIDDEFEIDHAIDALRYGLQWRDYSFKRIRVSGI